eukprot:m.140820 g.140820  ORF g.140820 m.140820 type:complete len:80 (+) comp38329_c0_seq2:2222-2461(+)
MLFRKRKGDAFGRLDGAGKTKSFLQEPSPKRCHPPAAKADLPFQSVKTGPLLSGTSLSSPTAESGLTSSLDTADVPGDD